LKEIKSGYIAKFLKNLKFYLKKYKTNFLNSSKLEFLSAYAWNKGISK